MAKDRYKQLREYYRDFAHHADDARRVGWRCRDDQVLRLEVLLEAVNADDYPCSVLDVGCGAGALYGLLDASDRMGEYCGVDLLPHMVAVARENHPNGSFEVSDLLKGRTQGVFDLVVCSGTLNVTVVNHEYWVRKMLAKMWEHTRWVLAVNFQTTRAHKYNPISADDDDIWHGQLGTLTAWCHQLSPWVTTRQDYLGDDVSFYIYRDYHKTAFRFRKQRPAGDPRSETQQACGLAYVLLERKLPDAALAVLDQVDGRDDARVLNQRGLCYHRLKRFTKARELYEAALVLEPRLEEARLNLEWINAHQ